MRVLRKTKMIAQRTARLAACWLLIGTGLLVPAVAVAQPPRSMAVDLPGCRLVGLPIHWSTRDAALLESTGRIRVFSSQEVLEHQVLGEYFQPQSLQQAAVQLQAELGNGFETLVTGPYVMAAPRGQAGRWESRFRTLLAGYLRYCEVRGWATRMPDFPLAVIVLPNRDEFRRFSAREIEGRTIQDNLAGMYIPRSNRCLLYQIEDTQSGTDWAATEATIVHEAIHQLAYNTGLHERLFQHPLWFVEGLATMFEVPAVYDASIPRSMLGQRIHAEKLAQLRPLLGDTDRLAAALQELVADDQLYRGQPETAYALGWALTFYLVERMPREYYDYVSLQRQRGFQPYRAGDRQLDFRAAFGGSPEQFAPRIQQLLRAN